jgi:uncharacterized membrane protein
MFGFILKQCNWFYVFDLSKIPMDKKKITKIITTSILMAAGAGVGFMAAKLGMDSAKATPVSQVIAVIIFLLPAFFLVIGIHEGGHAVAGSFVKFDFRMYVVGPFMWDKEESGWKFKWNKNVNVSGGMVICLPTTTENLAKRFSIYALGGPLASLLLTAFAYGIKELLSIINTNDQLILNLIGSIFGLISFLSVLIFIVTIIPLHIGGFYTDGARALRFLRGGDTARFEILLMKIISSSSGGIRPRLLDLNELDEALMLAKKLNAPMGVYLHGYYYQKALDEEKFDEAEKHLNEYIAEIESIPKGIQSSVWLDAAFFYAYARKDVQQAEYYWNKFIPSAIIPMAQVYATEAALNLLTDKKELVNQKIEVALRELPNMIDRGVGIALKDQLLHLQKNVA